MHESFGKSVADDHTPAEVPVPEYVVKWKR
jgi:hypothetical protein